MAFLYLIVITFWFRMGNIFLFSLLIFGEVFHLWQILTYLSTVWNLNKIKPANPEFNPPIDIFITVCGEPKEVVRRTVEAAKKQNYPDYGVFILNDGFVAGIENWMEIEYLAKEMGVICITRKISGGAKAGNINNALELTGRPFIAVLDADMVPQSNFLKELSPYMADPAVAFVQSPQYYKNHTLNQVTGGAWEQQELFFGPICEGKNQLNSVFMCGTNMLIRRQALEQVGGMCEDNIAEDFMTSLFVHERGWKSIYVPEVLAKGLAPEDFLSYYKQQFRWARGSLEILFRFNPIFRRGLTWQQKIQYLASASYYLSGLVVLINIALPLVYLITGESPVQVSTMALAAIFIPHICLTAYVLTSSNDSKYTFRALSFSNGSFIIFLKALWSVLTKQKNSFSVTSKVALDGNFTYLVSPHLSYIGLSIVALLIGWSREGVSPSLLSNLSWVLFNIATFIPFMQAAIPNLSFNLELVPSVLRTYASRSYNFISNLMI
ncbi:MAG: hypothetical protein OHK0017_12400 [Patescibacteria group bacterium]